MSVAELPAEQGAVVVDVDSSDVTDDFFSVTVKAEFNV